MSSLGIIVSDLGGGGVGGQGFRGTCEDLILSLDLFKSMSTRGFSCQCWPGVTIKEKTQLGPNLGVSLLPEPQMTGLCCWNHRLWFLILACVLFVCKHLCLWDSLGLPPILEHKQPEDRLNCLLFLTGVWIKPCKSLNKCSLLIHIDYSEMWGQNVSLLRIS